MTTKKKKMGLWILVGDLVGNLSPLETMTLPLFIISIFSPLLLRTNIKYGEIYTHMVEKPNLNFFFFITIVGT